MEVFKKRQVSFLLQLIVITLVLLVTHSYLHHYFSNSNPLFFPIWQVYAFHVFVTTAIYGIINYKYSFGQKVIFNLFMGMTLLKMILSILFLLPLFLSDFEAKRADIFNFFVPYFFFLFFEIFSLTKLLQNPE
ncbi:MAG: hypothetical protein CMP80_07020 [Formosa sp.]|nr:hypothetical protein [Formosa sp.]